MDGWIGVDLDGTLAVYEGWQGGSHIGEPIAPMVNRVKKWLAEGKDVRIVTARVAKGNPVRVEAATAVMDWCLIQFGRALPVTASKDWDMVELWDDRAVQVELNTGRRIDGRE